MSKSLRLLQLEDSEIDAALILRSLQRAGYNVDSECVQSAAEMRQALTRGPWDVIISDYRMPSFDAPEALAVLLDTGEDIPFIVVSGTIGEDSAVALMRAGAHDYLMKDRLTRLAAAVEREVRDAERRRQQREAEDALRESERCYRLISEHSGDVVWAYDPETGHFTYVSPSIQQMLGYTPSECLSISFADLVVPDAREAVIARVGERVARFENGATPASAEVRQTDLLHKNGTVVPAETTVWFPASGQERLEIVGVTRDTSERRKAEVALRESSLFNQQIVACASEGIIVYDRDLRYRAWNRFMEKLTGVRAEELIGKRPTDVFPFLEEAGILIGLERALAGEVVRSPDFKFSVEGSSRSGWCSDASSPLRDASGQIIGVIGIVHDLTDRKRLQDQFNQVQKLEAIGRLAGGVAHDFNNLLTVINGYGDLLLARMSRDDPHRAAIQEIRQSGGRAADLTQHLLAFSRKQIIEPKVLDLNQLVSDMRNMLRRLIGEDIRFEFNLDPSLGRVLADSGQLTQVVMNLAVNARDAMPEGGAFTLETANVEFPEGAQPPEIPGRFVRLTAADTGVGIDPATLQRIFEPFFTTKAEGKGTGLGLSTVYGIVQQSGGWIAVESSPGNGATFRVFLPRAEEDASGVQAIVQPVADLRGSETILVVEDQEDVRRFIVEALRGYGYAILEASEPGEALLIAERQTRPIHLLLTDIMMPHLTGIELAARLQPLRAGMRVLYMTGHTEQASVGDDFFGPGRALIRKPFSAEALMRKIREVLGSWRCPPETPPAGSDDLYTN
ncbi:MAG: PAS domain S-box protein [Bryobacteraceae bacterium]|nr:PAS domain S-box protein [Bryobacteraceae bacterium]